MSEENQNPVVPPTIKPSDIPPTTTKTQKKAAAPQLGAPGKKKKTVEPETERPRFWKKHWRTIAVPVVIALLTVLVTDVYTITSDWVKGLVGVDIPSTSTQVPTVSSPTKNDVAIAKDKHEEDYDTFTFKFTDPNKKLFSFGDCPGAHCYTVERGEMLSMWWVPSGRELIKPNGQETKGITFYIYGTGFVIDSRLYQDMAQSVLIEDRLFDIKMSAQGGLFGKRLLYVDGSFENRWANSDGSEPKWRKPPTKELKNYQLAVWLSLKNESSVSISTPDKDITLLVTDDSTNDFKIIEQVRPGTFCSRKHPSADPHDLQQACKGRG